MDDWTDTLDIAPQRALAVFGIGALL